jgi:hypothetical protein
MTSREVKDYIKEHGKIPCDKCTKEHGNFPCAQEEEQKSKMIQTPRQKLLVKKTVPKLPIAKKKPIFIAKKVPPKAQPKLFVKKKNPS